MMSQRRTIVWLGVLLAWTLFGALSALQIFVRDLAGSHPTSLLSVFNIVYFYWAWALLTPVVLRLAPRIDDTATTWPGRLVRQIPRAAVVLVAQAILYTTFLWLDRRIATGFVIATIPAILIRHLAGNLLTYAMLIAGTVVLSFYRQAQARELAASAQALRTSELEATLARSQLSALQSQLQPHFLFNTLNMISTLVARGEPVIANRAIARLGDLLRVALDAPEAQEATLDDEIRVTHHYAEIVALRFGSGVRITFDVDDATKLLCVPTLLLQPLIENAVRHGVGAGNRPLDITVTASLSDETLRVVVRDDGIGYDESLRSARLGRGLENIRQRLRTLYGARAGLLIANHGSGGAVVTVTLPVTVPVTRNAITGID